MDTPTPQDTADTHLLGRVAERKRLQQEMRKVRTGQSAVLVLRGGQGIGKTALLDHAAGTAVGYRVIRTQGAKSEKEFPYAGLQLLAAPLLDHLGYLQPSQRDALSTAIGLTTGPPPDGFVVGLAMLSLLSHAAEMRPLLCIIDDAQWLDRSSARVLAFVARRLDAQPIMILLAERAMPGTSELDHLPELRLEGLSRADMRMLLGRMVPGRIDQSVVERIVTEARGTPLAILELRSAISPAELAGGFGVTASGGLSSPIADDFLERVARLPRDSQRLLLTAAAEPVGDPWLLWRAAAHLGIPRETAQALASEALLSFGPRIAFPHPMLRLAIYGVATNAERHVVHRALCLATDPVSDPTRRVWHRAHAADGPDEDLAQQLERCAPMAQERGGLYAAAAFLEKAVLFTPAPGPRADRALAAAAVSHEAGEDHAATRLLLAAELAPLDDVQQARLERQRALIAAASSHGDDAPGLLHRAAERLEPIEPRLARETHLAALAAAISAGRLALEYGVADVAKAAQAGPPTIPPWRAIDGLLDGLVVRFTQGYSAAAEPLTHALTEWRDARAADQDTRWRWLAGRVAAELWDDETWDALTSLDVRLARDAGAVAGLPVALTHRALADVHFGEFSAASRLVDEATAIREATGASALPDASLLLAAWRGQEEPALEQFARARRGAHDDGEGLTLTTASLAAAVLHNSLGRYDEALAAARDASELDELGLLGWALTELIEAAARAGEPTTAALGLRRLTERTHLSGTQWALGIEARSRALLTEGQAAEELYREAIGRLERSKIRVDLARAQLVYGEWLRRQGRRLDARGPLRASRESFAAMGATAFAERAHRELLATGERVRRRSVSSEQQLTPQEARIALMARDGLSNTEIAGRIFVSPRTVEYHLSKVFGKLAIKSRTELHLVLIDTTGGPDSAPWQSRSRSDPRAMPPPRP